MGYTIDMRESDFSEGTGVAQCPLKRKRFGGRRELRILLGRRRLLTLLTLGLPLLRRVLVALALTRGLVALAAR